MIHIRYGGAVYCLLEAEIISHLPPEVLGTALRRGKMYNRRRRRGGRELVAHQTAELQRDAMLT